MTKNKKNSGKLKARSKKSKQTKKKSHIDTKSYTDDEILEINQKLNELYDFHLTANDSIEINRLDIIKIMHELKKIYKILENLNRDKKTLSKTSSPRKMNDEHLTSMYS